VQNVLKKQDGSNLVFCISMTPASRDLNTLIEKDMRTTKGRLFHI